MKLFFSLAAALSAGGFSGVLACPYLLEQKNRPSSSSATSPRRLQQDSGSGSFSGSRSEDEAFEFVCPSSPIDTSEEAIVLAQIAVSGILNSDEDLGPKFLRLAFHDCVGGGCNGSVDITDPDNAGLDEPIESLIPLVDCFAPQNLTRADIWVLAALQSMELLQDTESEDDVLVTFPFQYYGRSSMDYMEIGNGEVMPGAHFTTSEVLQYFNDTFGYTTQETVAIMGAHTLGRLSPRNSGFRGGKWVDNDEEIDNDYFEVLLDNNGELPNEKFIQTNEGSTNGQYLWTEGTRDDALLMINADMALVVDMDGYLDQETGLASCLPNKGATAATRNSEMPECPPAFATLPFVKLYDDDGDLWLSDFRDALLKMVNQQVVTNADLMEVDDEKFQSAVQKLGNPADVSTASTITRSSVLCATVVVLASIFV